ncbi:unnamed protein product [Cyprideis torosa]|uniref:Uncharacterized protein n=1 Tax=Cyprideis torosa TaxID=163714 RepID=A0A7R8W6R3_9CRUS|nr:unnamed protein product [Cyprideis torosa]CAG0881590.1 unnamed protein product [Cyprideis torosa]
MADDDAGMLAYDVNLLAVYFMGLEVNGTDVSLASHEEAIKVFEAAQEPIVVEVVKRSSTDDSSGRADCDSEECHPTMDSPEMITVSVQTELSELNPCFWDEEFDAYLENGVGGGDGAESFDEFSPFEYEEVALQRSSSQEKLGITLTYHTDPQYPTECQCYIEAIDPSGIAGSCGGKLRVQDQVLQINGQEVLGKEQVESIFGSAKRSVTFLVARLPQGETPTREPHPRDSGVDHDEAPDLRIDDEETEKPTFRESSMSTLDRPDIMGKPRAGGGSSKRRAPAASVAQPSVPEASPPHAKSGRDFFDSGTGTSCTTTSSSSQSNNSNSIDREFLILDKKVESIQHACDALASQPMKTFERNNNHVHLPTEAKHQSTLTPRPITQRRSPPTDSAPHAMRPLPLDRIPPLPPPNYHHTQDLHSPESEHLYETIPEVSEEVEYCVPFDAKKPACCSSSKRSSPPTAQRRSMAPPPPSSRVRSSSSASQTVSPDKQRDVEQWVEQTIVATSTPPSLARQHPLPQSQQLHSLPNTPVVKHLIKKQPSSSSSPRPRPLTFELERPQDPGHPQSNLRLSRDSPRCRTCGCTSPSAAVTKVTPPPDEDDDHPIQTVYTTKENLFQTILQQQEQLRKKQKQKTALQTASQPPQRCPLNSAPTATAIPPPVQGRRQYQYVSPSQDDPRAQWKVKIRHDGSRYIVRRPLRNRMLKERASQINEERGGGLTTDDEAQSELKFGRYWPKDERRRHVEEAKDRRRRQEAIIRSKQQQQQNGYAQDQVVPESQRKTSSSVANKSKRNSMPTAQKVLMENGFPARPDSIWDGGLISVTTV